MNEAEKRETKVVINPGVEKAGRRSKALRTPCIYTRDIISGPVSVARSATGVPLGGPPEGPPGGPPEPKKMRYMREYMPENQVAKVRLNASRTSKWRVSESEPKLLLFYNNGKKGLEK